MTRLPKLSDREAAREMVTAFRGLNHTPATAPDEFFDMENLTGAHYPALGPRARRAYVRKLDKPNGLFAHERLCWVDGTDFWYDGAVRGQVADGPKRFVAMGALILIWPDKAGYNTETDDFFHLDAEAATVGMVTCTLCRDDGTAYEGYATGPTAPEEPADGALWIDTRNTPHVLTQWSDRNGMWVTMPTTYVRIGALGIGAGFAAGDGVTIAGCENATLNGDTVLHSVFPDAVIVTGIIDAVSTQEARVTIRRTAPDMDYLTEHRNRVWGCSSASHEVYACKLGDPKNWRCYQGAASDSYAATIGTPGVFTGTATHGGSVFFFKEDCIHKLFGYKPSNYEITDIRARGVQAGSAGSLCVVNETLFYKSPGDMCAFGAALPEGIGAALGSAWRGEAVAGTAEGRYYVSLRDAGGAWSLYVFDAARGHWRREDGTRALAFARAGGTLYCLRGDGWILNLTGDDPGPYATEAAHTEAVVRWWAESGDVGMASPDKKYVRKVQLRLAVARGALVRVLVRYDGAGAFREVRRINAGGAEGADGARAMRSVAVSVLPRRCDTMRIRIEGVGEARLYAMTRTVEGGSDV